MKKIVGVSSKEMIRLAIDRLVSEESLELYHETYLFEYINNQNPKTVVFPYIKDVIEKLKSNGCKVCAFSNKSQEEVVSLSNGILKYLQFDYLLGVSDDILPKPSISGVEYLLKKFCIDPKNSFFIGDGETDVEVALNSGINGVAVLWGNRGKSFLKKCGAVNFAKTPQDILKFIQ